MTKLNLAEKPTDGTLGTDLIFGAASIAAELGVSTRRAFYLCEHQYIPAKKLGATWVCSRQKLREHFDMTAQ